MTMRRTPRNRSAAWAALATWALAGCAPLPPQPPVAGRVQLALPAGDWVDLGPLAPLAVPSGDTSLPLERRLAALRHPQGGWAAAVVLGAVPQGATWAPTALPACTARRGETVDDQSAIVLPLPQGVRPVRADCLRTKLWADNRDWLAQNRPDLQAALAAAGVTVRSSAGLVSHTYTTATGAYVSLDVLADQALLVPPTRNAAEFLQAGQPVARWAQELARAVRASTGMLNGQLALPPFPFALAPQPASSASAPPTAAPAAASPRPAPAPVVQPSPSPKES